MEHFTNELREMEKKRSSLCASGSDENNSKEDNCAEAQSLSVEIDIAAEQDVLVEVKVPHINPTDKGEENSNPDCLVDPKVVESVEKEIAVEQQIVEAQSDGDHNDSTDKTEQNSNPDCLEAPKHVEPQEVEVHIEQQVTSNAKSDGDHNESTDKTEENSSPDCSRDPKLVETVEIEVAIEQQVIAAAKPDVNITVKTEENSNPDCLGAPKHVESVEVEATSNAKSDGDHNDSTDKTEENSNRDCSEELNHVETVKIEVPLEQKAISDAKPDGNPSNPADKIEVKSNPVCPKDPKTVETTVYQDEEDMWSDDDASKSDPPRLATLRTPPLRDRPDRSYRYAPKNSPIRYVQDNHAYRSRSRSYDSNRSYRARERRSRSRGRRDYSTDREAGIRSKSRSRRRRDYSTDRESRRKSDRRGYSTDREGAERKSKHRSKHRRDRKGRRKSRSRSRSRRDYSTDRENGRRSRRRERNYSDYSTDREDDERSKNRNGRSTTPYRRLERAVENRRSRSPSQQTSDGTRCSYSSQTNLKSLTRNDRYRWKDQRDVSPRGLHEFPKMSTTDPDASPNGTDQKREFNSSRTTIEILRSRIQSTLRNAAANSSPSSTVTSQKASQKVQSNSFVEHRSNASEAKAFNDIRSEETIQSKVAVNIDESIFNKILLTATSSAATHWNSNVNTALDVDLYDVMQLKRTDPRTKNVQSSQFPVVQPTNTQTMLHQIKDPRIRKMIQTPPAISYQQPPQQQSFQQLYGQQLYSEPSVFQQQQLYQQQQFYQPQQYYQQQIPQQPTYQHEKPRFGSEKMYEQWGSCRGPKDKRSATMTYGEYKKLQSRGNAPFTDAKTSKFVPTPDSKVSELISDPVAKPYTELISNAATKASSEQILTAAKATPKATQKATPKAKVSELVLSEELQAEEIISREKTVKQEVVYHDESSNEKTESYEQSSEDILKPEDAKTSKKKAKKHKKDKANKKSVASDKKSSKPLKKSKKKAAHETDEDVKNPVIPREQSSAPKQNATINMNNSSSNQAFSALKEIVNPQNLLTLLDLMKQMNENNSFADVKNALKMCAADEPTTIVGNSTAAASVSSQAKTKKNEAAKTAVGKSKSTGAVSTGSQAKPKKNEAAKTAVGKTNSAAAAASTVGPTKAKKNELVRLNENITNMSLRDRVLSDNRKFNSPSAGSVGSQTKPKKNELDRLHEDINNMFIRDGVLSANGRKRTCPKTEVESSIDDVDEKRKIKKRRFTCAGVNLKQEIPKPSSRVVKEWSCINKGPFILLTRMVQVKKTRVKNNNPEWHSLKAVLPCQVCYSPPGISLISHYVNLHPDYEVLNSRLSPEAAICLRSSTDYPQCEVIRSDAGVLFKQFCYFCNANGAYTKQGWISHMVRHTGYFDYKCNGCSRKFSTKAQYHGCGVPNSAVEKIIQPVFEQENIVAYVCELCNYVRFYEDEIKRHLNNEHEANEMKEFKEFKFFTLPPAGRIGRPRKE